jgi:hypothetical protein
MIENLLRKISSRMSLGVKVGGLVSIDGKTRPVS